MIDPLALALRKQALLRRSQDLREAITADAAGLGRVFHLADTLAAGAHWVRSHRLASLGALALVLVLRPRTTLRWARRALLAWGICRRAGTTWQKSLALWREVRA